MRTTHIVHDDDRRGLEARFFVETVGDTCTLVFESRGGNPDRNTGYNDALEIALRRLGDLHASLQSVEVYSATTQALAADDRRVEIDDYPQPVLLDTITNYEALRIRIGAGAARVARAPEARGSGNMQRRLRLFLTFGGPRPTDQELTDIVSWGLLTPATVTNDDGAHVPHTRRPRANGQGRESDPQVRKAIELRAVEAATKYYTDADWIVEDVGTAHHGYDLLCKRGHERLFVEVKGSKGAGASVTLTANEVRSAKENPKRSELFVLAKVQVVPGSSGLKGEGGVRRVLRSWNPTQTGELVIKTYTYELPDPG